VGGTCGLSAGAQNAPAATANEGPEPVNLSAARWYPILLLRNALGRFMALRINRPSKPRRRHSPRPVATTVQLVLF
jgi:hypothetical protein